MRRLLDIIWCRLAFYDYWNEISTTPEQIVEIPRLRREFPSVYAVIQTALNEKAPLEEIGQFIRVIDKTTLRLALLLIQMPTPTQITDFFEELRSYTLSRCPNFKVQNLQFPELATLLQNRMRDWRRVNPSMDFLSGLSFEGYADLQTAVRILSPLTRSVCGAMIRSFIPMFKKYMTSHGFGMIRQGYRIESGPTIPPTPWPGLLIHHIMLDEFDNGFRPTGERVRLELFCTPAKEVKDADVCAVCMEEVKMKTDEEEESPVVTPCNHLFHQGCLDAWVNESYMQQSNSCPSCRQELCQKRQRTHVSRLPQGEAREGNVISYAL